MTTKLITLPVVLMLLVTAIVMCTATWLLSQSYTTNHHAIQTRQSIYNAVLRDTFNMVWSAKKVQGIATHVDAMIRKIDHITGNVSDVVPSAKVRKALGPILTIQAKWADQYHRNQNDLVYQLARAPQYFSGIKPLAVRYKAFTDKTINASVIPIKAYDKQLTHVLQLMRQQLPTYH